MPAIENYVNTTPKEVILVFTAYEIFF